MAMDSGELTLTLEFAQGLKDVEWIGRQDPYVILTCGSQQFRSRMIQGGGQNPIWNETFRFHVLNESEISVVVKDADVTKTTLIGSGRLQLAKARAYGSDRQQVPLITKRGHAMGYVSFSMTFHRAASALHHAPYPQQPHMHAAPAPYGQPSGHPAGAAYPYSAAAAAPPYYAPAAPPAPYMSGMAPPPAYAAPAPSYVAPAPYYGHTNPPGHLHTAINGLGAHVRRLATGR